MFRTASARPEITSGHLIFPLSKSRGSVENGRFRRSSIARKVVYRKKFRRTGDPVAAPHVRLRPDPPVVSDDREPGRRRYRLRLEESAPPSWIRAFRASLFGLPPARAALAARIEFVGDEVVFSAPEKEYEATREALETNITRVNQILSGGTGR